jgi:hypothetical protein
MKVCTCRDHVTDNAVCQVRRVCCWRGSMYMSKRLMNNTICHALRASYRRKYAHVEGRLTVNATWHSLISTGLSKRRTQKIIVQSKNGVTFWYINVS